MKDVRATERRRSLQHCPACPLYVALDTDKLDDVFRMMRENGVTMRW